MAYQAVHGMINHKTFIEDMGKRKPNLQNEDNSQSLQKILVEKENEINMLKKQLANEELNKLNKLMETENETSPKIPASSNNFQDIEAMHFDCNLLDDPQEQNIQHHQPFQYTKFQHIEAELPIQQSAKSSIHLPVSRYRNQNVKARPYNVGHSSRQTLYDESIVATSSRQSTPPLKCSHKPAEANSSRLSSQESAIIEPMPNSYFCAIGFCPNCHCEMCEINKINSNIFGLLNMAVKIFCRSCGCVICTNQISPKKKVGRPPKHQLKLQQ